MTLIYCVVIPNSVRKALETIEEPLRARIVRRLDALASNPRPRGAVKLTDQPNTFRLRTGDWRIVYEVRDAELLVLLVKIGHLREVYR
jgi:mRNA interferase RelE/StbE